MRRARGLHGVAQAELVARGVGHIADHDSYLAERFKSAVHA